MPYRTIILSALTRIDRRDVPTALVYASMLLQYGTLDHLDRSIFADEAKTAAIMWDTDPEACTRLVESYGLTIEPASRREQEVWS